MVSEAVCDTSGDSGIAQFDIVIVGAGMAGSALACALTQTASPTASLRIALVEAQPLRDGWPPLESGIDGFDLRVSAMTKASQDFLDSIDVWPAIAGQRVSRFEKMQVWDAEGTGAISFDAADVRAPALGHIVENRVTVAALLNTLRDRQALRMFDGVAVESLTLPQRDGDHALIQLADGSALESTLVVAADGAQSRLRNLTEMPMREWDYAHDAIVCTAQTELPHQETAWQRFTPYGPLAFLPLASADEQHFCSVVWSQRRDRASELLSLQDVHFCAQLERALEGRLGSVRRVSTRTSFPLRQRHAVDYVRPGFALVADAAHTVHPLAGQGINLGFGDVQVLAETLQMAVQRKQNVGDLAVLKKFQRQRKGDNLAMMAAIEGFKRLFEQAPLPLRWLRNAGMSRLDKHARLKNMIVKRAMGIG